MLENYFNELDSNIYSWNLKNKSRRCLVYLLIYEFESFKGKI